VVFSGTSTDGLILVSEEDFQLALGTLSPSVSQAELRRYEAIENQFTVNATPANGGQLDIDNTVDRLEKIVDKYVQDS